MSLLQVFSHKNKLLPTKKFTLTLVIIEINKGKKESKEAE